MPTYATSPRSAVNGISIIPGDPLPPLAIASFTADRGYVTPGETVTLSWSASGAESFELSPGIGPVAGTSAVVTPGTTTTYTLTARRGTESATTTVRVGAGPARPNLLRVLVDDMGAMETSVPGLHLVGSARLPFATLNVNDTLGLVGEFMEGLDP